MVVFGAWLALAGAIACLAGVAGTGRRRKLRNGGLQAWAMVLLTPSEPDEDRSVSSGVSVQFALEDGRVIERPHVRPARRSMSLQPGERVLVWYDPADPGDILVYGSDGRRSDRAFLAVGAVLLVVGIVLAVGIG